MKRPSNKNFGSYISVPSSNFSISLLGPGISNEACMFSRDEFKRMKELYEFDEDDDNPLLESGANRNLMRHASCDGMRLIAYLSQFCEKGEDPVKVLVRWADELGLNVSHEDLEWAKNEPEI